MTQEEARKHMMLWVYSLDDMPPKQATEALTMAADALLPVSREQVEKVFGGEWKEYEAFPMAPSLNGYPCSRCGTHISPSSVAWMNFCPRCGAPMSDKAVDMVMERLEALKDETD